MTTSHTPPPDNQHVPGPLTAEKVRRFRADVAAVQERLRERGVDPSRLPDPVEELVKARDAGYET
jgi:endonuclease/exonuclease/phosphatase family metal-dependent hydrolase